MGNAPPDRHAAWKWECPAHLIVLELGIKEDGKIGVGFS